MANRGNGTVSEFAPGSTTPTATLTGLSNPEGLAFDGSGNLYVANKGNGTVSEFAPGSTTPTATLTGLSYPVALAFDSSGNLYVANEIGTTVSEFAPGSTTPTATLTGLDNPVALAFDSSGNLFVANYDVGTVSEFAPGSTTPTATLDRAEQSLALAFDSSGNLYVANGSMRHTVSEFAPGSTTPTATLTGLNNPGALAFDSSGNLYVANNGNGTVSVFAPGSTTPTATLTGLSKPRALAFHSTGRGNLYVANQGNGTVSEFIASGNESAQTIGLYDPTTSVFYLRDTNDSGYADLTFAYGAAGAGWVPIAGDWNADGTDTIGLYNPTTSTFYLRNTNNGGYADLTFRLWPGRRRLACRLPATGTADGTVTIGLYNPATSTFYLRNTNNSGYADLTFAYGRPNAGWLPIAGDWNGDGKDTIGLYNPDDLRVLPAEHEQRRLCRRDLSPMAQPAPVGNPSPATGMRMARAPSVCTTRQAPYSTCGTPTTAGYADMTFAYGAASAGWMPIAGDWNWSGGCRCMAAGGAVVAAPANVLGLDPVGDLRPIVREAIARWAGGRVAASSLSRNWRRSSYVVADLPGSYLGEAEGNMIYLDGNAAGYGWFVDPTPAVDEEFAPSPSSQQLRAIDPRAVDRIDLLTVVEHELGHVAGLGDLDASVNDLMSGVLGTGTRRNASHVDAALASE